MNKGVIVFLSSLILLCTVLGVSFYTLSNYKHDVKYLDKLILDIDQEKYIKDYISVDNSKVINKKICCNELGKKEVKFSYKNKFGFTVWDSFVLDVVDTKGPYIRNNGRYSVRVNGNKNWYKNIIVLDNFDTNPSVILEGEYNINKPGEYLVNFKATDKSNNISVLPIKLNVYKPSLDDSYNNDDDIETHTLFSDVKSYYKDHKVGLDVSEWQGDIDFNKLKKAGVDFIFIRIGGTRGDGKTYYLDSSFKRNIKEAKKYGISVGVYMFCYTHNKEQSIKAAEWVVENLEGEELDLPIVFDWEDFGDFNSYHFSKRSFNDMGKSFIDIVKKSGYDGMIYSSKSYLEDIWDIKDPVWLAHYLYDYKDKSSYKGKYKFWQICNDGVVDGILGNTDINIMY